MPRFPSSWQGSGLGVFGRCEPMALSLASRSGVVAATAAGPLEAASGGSLRGEGVAATRASFSRGASRCRGHSCGRLGARVLRTCAPVREGISRVLGRRERLHRTIGCRSQEEDEKDLDSIEDLNLEDLDDEQLDELFENYGEIVKESPEPERVSSELDDDAESLAFAVALAEVANEVKAGEIQVLFVKPLVYWTRFFVIVTGFSRPQVDAIGKKMRDMAEERFNRTARGDLKPNTWTLLDFGDIVVHIFYPKERSFYNLEEFYGNATTIELPFKSESQVR